MSYSQEQRWDHQRDLAKHGDLNPKPVDAHTVATLVRHSRVSFDEAVALIEQFGAFRASEGAVKATKETRDSMMEAFDAVAAA